MHSVNHALYLASASPRRHELLNQVGIRHEVILPPSPEGEDEPIYANETAIDYVQRTALDKLKHAVAWRASQPNRHQDWPILCADTTVELNGEILGKPIDLEHAAQLLACLSDNVHQVHTAACLYYQGQYFQTLSSSRIYFKPLTDAEIKQYCASHEPLGKAGAYGIQGQAAIFIKHLEGSYSGVMGLDLFQTHQLLQSAKLR